MPRLPVFALLAALCACGTAAAQPLVQPAWLKAHLGDPNVVVLDIRPRDQAAGDHIPATVQADYEKAGWRVKSPDGSGGALPPVDQIASLIAGLGVGDTTHAVIVGDDFGATARVYWTFKVLGHRDVSILDGGWTHWSTGGFPVTAATSAPRNAAKFTPRYDASIRAELLEVEQTLASGNRTLIDARPPAQWQGTAKSPAVAAFGRLPHAVWIDQSDALIADGTALKPKAALVALFEQVGKAPVTTYCNTGHLAATDWFVLSEVLHHPDVRLYDASLSQWAHDPARPIVR
jgi:thiosulfate/3-mercaptopyruvate sulfurtransferase